MLVSSKALLPQMVAWPSICTNPKQPSARQPAFKRDFLNCKPPQPQEESPSKSITTSAWKLVKEYLFKTKDVIAPVEPLPLF